MPKTKKIDTVDAKILKTLLRDSRTSFTQISKDCKISVTAVRRRYDRLKKAGIITGELVEVNLRSFGIENIVEIGIKASVDNEENVREFLKKNRHIIAAELGTETFGKYNIVALAVLPKMADLTTVIKEVASNPDVKGVETLVWTDSTGTMFMENLEITPFVSKDKKEVATESLLLNMKQTPIVELEGAQIDQVDRQIVNILSRNSRTPFDKIAKQIGVSTKNVIQRYKKLREGNVLIKSTISVNLKKLGYNCLAFVFLKLQNINRMEELQEKLFRIPNLIESSHFAGAYDLRATFALRDIQELLNLAKHIRKIEGIEDVQIFPNDLYLNSYPPLMMPP